MAKKPGKDTFLLYRQQSSDLLRLGSEVSCTSGRMPSCSRYQPTLATEIGTNARANHIHKEWFQLHQFKAFMYPAELTWLIQLRDAFPLTWMLPQYFLEQSPELWNLSSGWILWILSTPEFFLQNILGRRSITVVRSAWKNGFFSVYKRIGRDINCDLGLKKLSEEVSKSCHRASTCAAFLVLSVLRSLSSSTGLKTVSLVKISRITDQGFHHDYGWGIGITFLRQRFSTLVR